MISCRSNLGDCGKLVRNPRRAATPLFCLGNVGGKYPLTPPLSQVILNKTSAPNDLSVIVSDADFLSRTMMDSTNYDTSFDRQLDLVISGTFFDI